MADDDEYYEEEYEEVLHIDEELQFLQMTIKGKVESTDCAKLVVKL